MTFNLEDRPPAGAGANRFDRQRLLDAPHLFALAAFEREAAPEPPPTRRRKRRPSVASVIRQMRAAGVEVASCEVRDGVVRVLSGKPVGDIDVPDVTPIDRSEWN